MDPINDNDKTYEKCEYHNKNLNELGMNDANRAYKNRLNKTQINLNKSLKNIEINNLIAILQVLGWYKKIAGIIMGKNLEKGGPKKIAGKNL